MDIKTIEAGLLASSFRGAKGNMDSMTITISEHKVTTKRWNPEDRNYFANRIYS